MKILLILYEPHVVVSRANVSRDISLSSNHCVYFLSPVVATKEIGLEVNGDKTKYMVMSQEQTAVTL